MLEAGLLTSVLSILSAQADLIGAPSSAALGSGGGGVAAPSAATPLLRVAAWCLHTLAKHKREKEMVSANGRCEMLEMKHTSRLFVYGHADPFGCQFRGGGRE